MTQTLNNQPNQSDKAPANHKKMGTTMLAMAWMCLLGVIFIIFYLFDGEKTKVVTNSEGDIELHIPISRDHSYELSGKVNDAAAHFLVDTGASSIAIPEKIAIGIVTSPSYFIGIINNKCGESAGLIIQPQSIIGISAHCNSRVICNFIVIIKFPHQVII